MTEALRQYIGAPRPWQLQQPEERRLDVRKTSFLPMDRAVALSGMEYGATNPKRTDVPLPQGRLVPVPLTDAGHRVDEGGCGEVEGVLDVGQGGCPPGPPAARAAALQARRDGARARRGPAEPTRWASSTGPEPASPTPTSGGRRYRRHVPRVTTDRLELKPLPAKAAALLAEDRDGAAAVLGAALAVAWPEPNLVGLLRLRPPVSPEAEAFGVWVMIERTTRVVIGDVGSKGRPGDAAVVRLATRCCGGTARPGARHSRHPSTTGIEHSGPIGSGARSPA